MFYNQGDRWRRQNANHNQIFPEISGNTSDCDNTQHSDIMRLVYSLLPYSYFVTELPTIVKAAGTSPSNGGESLQTTKAAPAQTTASATVT